jgi:glycosyltransferase involved in cell wall biosynthesis
MTGMAMAAGLPIISTPTCSMADHLVDGINALFVPSQSPEALARAMLKLASEPVLRDSMRAANLAKVRAFAPDLVARNYLESLGAIREARRQ